MGTIVSNFTFSVAILQAVLYLLTGLNWQRSSSITGTHCESRSVWSSALKIPLKPMEGFADLGSRPWRNEAKISVFSAASFCSWCLNLLPFEPHPFLISYSCFENPDCYFHCPLSSLRRKILLWMGCGSFKQLGIGFQSCNPLRCSALKG